VPQYTRPPPARRLQHRPERSIAGSWRWTRPKPHPQRNRECRRPRVPCGVGIQRPGRGTATRTSSARGTIGTDGTRARHRRHADPDHRGRRLSRGDVARERPATPAAAVPTGTRRDDQNTGGGGAGTVERRQAVRVELGVATGGTAASRSQRPRRRGARWWRRCRHRQQLHRPELQWCRGGGCPHPGRSGGGAGTITANGAAAYNLTPRTAAAVVARADHRAHVAERLPGRGDAGTRTVASARRGPPRQAQPARTVWRRGGRRWIFTSAHDGADGDRGCQRHHDNRNLVYGSSPGTAGQTARRRRPRSGVSGVRSARPLDHQDRAGQRQRPRHGSVHAVRIERRPVERDGAVGRTPSAA